MKIADNERISQTLHTQSVAKPTISGHKGFGSILQETIKNSKAQAPATMPTISVNPMTRMQPLTAQTADQKFTVQGIEDMINLLDRYREQLADPRVSLRKIDPVIQDMTREMEKLAPVLDSLSGGDELRQLLNQALVTASLEISKFYRGDYISA